MSVHFPSLRRGEFGVSIRVSSAGGQRGRQLMFAPLRRTEGDTVMRDAKTLVETEQSDRRLVVASTALVLLVVVLITPLAGAAVPV